MRYLEDMLMAEITIPFASFKPYHGQSCESFINVQTNMILDSMTQESLEIFLMNPEEEVNDKMHHKCLADLVDTACTPFGRRLVRKWLGAPLIDTD